MKRVTENSRILQRIRQRDFLRHNHKKRTAKKRKISQPLRQLILAPARLNLITYKEETLEFLNSALDKALNCQPNKSLFFDLSGVKEISAGVVMYIIAIVYNAKHLNKYNIRCEGSMPKDECARQQLEKFGFHKYVTGLVPEFNNTNDHMWISCGTIADNNLAGDICDFVCDHSNSTILNTKRLYPMLIELMTNTCQHAYNDDSWIMEKSWYIYVEDTESSVDFVFLDTGVGIPTTIRLNAFEQAYQTITNDKGDAKYITSALHGNNRTETRKPHRGKGLPGIYEDAKNGKISDLRIISGRGECVVLNDSPIQEYTSIKEFRGTLFCWKFNKHKEVIK